MSDFSPLPGAVHATDVYYPTDGLAASTAAYQVSTSTSICTTTTWSSSASTSTSTTTTTPLTTSTSSTSTSTTNESDSPPPGDGDASAASAARPQLDDAVARLGGPARAYGLLALVLVLVLAAAVAAFCCCRLLRRRRQRRESLRRHHNKHLQMQQQPPLWVLADEPAAAAARSASDRALATPASLGPSSSLEMPPVPSPHSTRLPIPPSRPTLMSVFSSGRNAKDAESAALESKWFGSGRYRNVTSGSSTSSNRSFGGSARKSDICVSPMPPPPPPIPSFIEPSIPLPAQTAPYPQSLSHAHSLNGRSSKVLFSNIPNLESRPPLPRNPTLPTQRYQAGPLTINTNLYPAVYSPVDGIAGADAALKPESRTLNATRTEPLLPQTESSDRNASLAHHPRLLFPNKDIPPPLAPSSRKYHNSVPILNAPPPPIKKAPRVPLNPVSQTQITPFEPSLMTQSQDKSIHHAQLKTPTQQVSHLRQAKNASDHPSSPFSDQDPDDVFAPNSLCNSIQNVSMQHDFNKNARDASDRDFDADLSPGPIPASTSNVNTNLVKAMPFAIHPPRRASLKHLTDKPHMTNISEMPEMLRLGMLQQPAETHIGFHAISVDDSIHDTLRTRAKSVRTHIMHSDTSSILTRTETTAPRDESDTHNPAATPFVPVLSGLLRVDTTNSRSTTQSVLMSALNAASDFSVDDDALNTNNVSVKRRVFSPSTIYSTIDIDTRSLPRAYSVGGHSMTEMSSHVNNDDAWRYSVSRSRVEGPVRDDPSYTIHVD